MYFIPRFRSIAQLRAIPDSRQLPWPSDMPMPHSFDLPSHVAALDTWSVYWILKVVKNHVAGYYTSSLKSHQPVDEIRIFYQFHCLQHFNKCRISSMNRRMYIIFCSLLLPWFVVKNTKSPFQKNPTWKESLRGFKKPCLLQAAMALVKSFKCNRTSASQWRGKDHTCWVYPAMFCLIPNETRSKRWCSENTCTSGWLDTSSRLWNDKTVFSHQSFA